MTRPYVQYTNRLDYQNVNMNSRTVEAPVHPREAEKVFATGAVHLRECVNTEFV